MADKEIRKIQRELAENPADLEKKLQLASAYARREKTLTQKILNLDRYGFDWPSIEVPGVILEWYRLRLIDPYHPPTEETAQWISFTSAFFDFVIVGNYLGAGQSYAQAIHSRLKPDNVLIVALNEPSKIYEKVGCPHRVSRDDAADYLRNHFLLKFLREVEE